MTRPRALLLDAMGTLLELEPPVPRLRRLLAERLGLAVSEARAQEALAGEIAFYRAHHLEGADAASLSDLRARCTEVLRAGLGPAGAGADPGELQAAMLGALRFRAYPEVPDALAALRAAGLRLVVVSNWDCSLPTALEQAGLERAVDAVVSSAALGVAKPAAAIFEHALEVAGVPARQAWHVGDSLDEDVLGAQAAGATAVLVAREPAAGGPGGIRTVRSLAELAATLA